MYNKVKHFLKLCALVIKFYIVNKWALRHKLLIYIKKIFWQKQRSTTLNQWKETNIIFTIFSP